MPDGAPRLGKKTLAIAVGAAAVIVAAWLLLFNRANRIRRDPGLSVLLITIDTLRADALGAYGNAAALTPWIDRLAREGVMFSLAHAENVVTLPSHANLLTGQYPFHHGIRDNSGFRLGNMPTLASMLKAQGYHTAAFVSAFPLAARFGLNQGFDVYDDRLGGAETHTAFVEPERRGGETVRLAALWLKKQEGARAFCFVHIYEPHFPYEPPEPYASRFRHDPYHGEVAAADAILEPLLRPLLEAGRGGRTLVVLTSDHGESLGEHGEATHGVFAYEATLRVPLILYAPGLLSPAILNTPVQHVDVVPTVLDALAIVPPTGLPGRSLLPVAAGRPDSVPGSYFEALSSSLNRGWAPLRGSFDGRLKYIDLPIPELYDLTADPGETKNLMATQPADAERMRAAVSRYRAADTGGTRVAEDAATRERLRALGYVSGNAPTKERYDEGDDPKRLIGLDAKLSEIVTLHQKGDYRAAIAVCRSLVAERPGMPLAYKQLAFLENAAGDSAAAIDALRQALALRPSDAETVALLGVYLANAGQAREAETLLGSFLAAQPADVDVLTARGMALAQLGRRDEARELFSRAQEIDPTNGMPLINAGTVSLMEGDLARARASFLAALDLDPGIARAHNSLGVIAFREGRIEEALERWRRAVALDPTDYQTLFNLGSTLRKLERPTEARPYLEEYLRRAPASVEAKDLARVRTWLAETRAPAR